MLPSPMRADLANLERLCNEHSALQQRVVELESELQAANDALANARLAGNKQQQQQHGQQPGGASSENDRRMAIGSVGFSIACAAVGARMDWCAALLLPALADRLPRQPAFRYSVLLAVTFVACFIIATWTALHSAQLDRACAAAPCSSTRARMLCTRSPSLPVRVAATLSEPLARALDSLPRRTTHAEDDGISSR